MLAGVAQDQLRLAAGEGEGDVAHLAPHQQSHQVGRLQVPAAAAARHLLHDRRVPEDDELAAPGRTVIGDHAQGQPGQLRCQLLGVGDGRRAADEAWIGPVVGAEAPQPPDDVGRVRAEDAPVRVDLVEHDILQVAEEVRPRVVVGQDAHMQHVGVGQHDLGVALDQPAAVARRVAVVGVGHEALPGAVVAELAQLVLRQGLGGVDQQRPAPGVAVQRVHDRQQVGQGLPAGRAGHGADVLAAQHRRDGLGLVAIEALDALGGQQ